MSTHSTLFDIQHLASLARLNLTKEECALFEKQIQEILSYFKKLNEVDTAHSAPTFQVIPGLFNHFQEQELESDTLSQEAILKNAPQKNNGYVMTNKKL